MFYVRKNHIRMEKTMKRNIWLDGMMGLVIGDALGVPVQFMTRNEIESRLEGPVTTMEAGGVFNMPEGTWSDDSSMAIATLCQWLHCLPASVQR